MDFTSYFSNFGANSETVNLILLGVVLLFIIFAAFWGLIRGLKKTVFRGVWLMITALILFFVTPFITQMVYTFDISFLNLTIEGIDITTLKSFVETYIAQNPDIAFLAAENEFIHSVVVNLPGIFLNFILYVLLFWIFKILLYPIWAICSAIFIKKKNIKGEKLKKHRLLGALVGVVIGLFVGSTTLMPVFNMVTLAQQIEEATKEQSSTNTGLLTELMGSDYYSMIGGVKGSYADKIYSYTGFQQLNGAIFNGLTTTVINEQEINLKTEVLIALNTYSLATQLMDMGFDDLDQQKIDDLLVILDDLVETVFSSGLLASFANKAIPLVATEAVSGNNDLIKLPTTDNEIADQAMVDAVNQIKTVTFKNIGSDLRKLISIAKTLNDENIITEAQTMLENNTGSNQDYLDFAGLLNEELINSVMQDLTSTTLLTKLMPVGLDAVISYGVDMLDIEGFALTNASVTSQNLYNLFSGVLNTALIIANSVDLNSDYYIQSSSIAQIGKLIDTLTAYPRLGTANLNLLKQAAVTKINNYLNQNVNPDDFSIPLQVYTAALQVVDNLTLISNFESEFEIYGLIFDDAISIYETFKNDNTVDPVLVGSVLDTIRTSTLFGNEIDNIMRAGIDYAITLVPDDFADAIPTLNAIKNNINASLVWETELAHFSNLVDLVLEVMEDDTMLSNLTDTQNLARIGAILDDIKSSSLFNKYQEVGGVLQLVVGDNLINDIIRAGLDYSMDLVPTTFGDLGTIIVNIKNNVIEVNSWEEEFTVLSGFINYFMNNMNDSSFMDNLMTPATLEEIGTQLNSIKQSHLIGDQIKNLIGAMIDTMIGEELDESDPNYDPMTAIMNGVINEIKTNILALPDSVDWAHELRLIGELLEEVSDPDNIAIDTIGAVLDSIISENSLILTTATINNIVVDLMDIFVEGYNLSSSMVNDLKAAVLNITSYTTELSALNSFITDATEILEGTMDPETFTISAFGATLDGYDTALINALKPHIMIMIAETLGDIDPVFSGVYQDAVDNAHLITSYEDELDALQGIIDAFNGYFDGGTFNMTQLGTALDNLAATHTLGSVADNIFIKVIEQVETDNAGNQEALDLIAQIEVNIITGVANSTFTYAQAFAELELLENIVADLVNIDQNFDPSVVGAAFNSLSDLNIYGESATRDLALSEIQQFLDEANDELAGYTQGVDPEYDIIAQRIADLQVIYDNLETEVNLYSIDYLIVFGDIEALLP